VYTDTSLDFPAFNAAHQILGEELNGFIRSLETGDQCQAQIAAAKVSQAMWDMLLLFGTPVYTNASDEQSS
jgi:hypothetical protein